MSDPTYQVIPHLIVDAGPEFMEFCKYVTIHLQVPNVDALFAQATAAGAMAVMPPMDMFWGDRFAKVIDPFGHHWSIATNKEKLTPAEMQRRGEEAMKNLKM
jgi:uncharacterized glyoxalase superfamily protein PhnB